MAERRMFAKTIVLSDAFLDMPLSARCLYFTLGMLADDDGFVNSPKAVMRQCGASDDDMNILLKKKFLLLFENGVIVIKHWRINNYLRNDRHIPTKYQEELGKLTLMENGSYSDNPENTVQKITEDAKSKDEYEEVFEMFEAEFKRQLSSSEAMLLSELLVKYGPIKLRNALRQALIYNKPTIAYVEGILVNWENEQRKS